MDPYSSGYGNGPYPSKPPSEGKAVLAFVLGLMSFFVCGLTGIPAIVLGFSARADIARSEGAKAGGGLAAAGIVTGFFGTLMTLGSVAMLVLSAVMGGSVFRPPSSHPTPPPALHGPSGMGTSATGPGSMEGEPVGPPSESGPKMPLLDGKIGVIRVIDLDPDAKASFHEQLANEVKRARAAKQTPLVMTSAKWCSVCREFEDAMTDPRMQTALAKVSLVRVDIEAWGDELRERGMLEPTLPWFYKLDASLHPTDAISAGEWDDNVPANMAPVLQAFLGGTLRARRNPSSLGTSL